MTRRPGPQRLPEEDSDDWWDQLAPEGAVEVLTPRPRPGPAVLPRSAWVHEAVSAYARMMRRRTRLWFPVVAVLVVVRVRSQKHQRRGGPR